MNGAYISNDSVEEYLGYASNGEGPAGVRVALDFLDRGVDSDDVIVDLLGAAQHESGERWFKNIWSVAEEPLVSGVPQGALDAVANSIEPPAPGSFVLVACAEGDWHSLPAQMFAEMLVSRGFAIAFMGASTPAEHMSSFITRHRPDALVVSCALPLFFSGVTRLADAAHRQGIPVLAGGRALGHDSKRARALGADAWSDDVDDATSILRAWQLEPPLLPTEPTQFNQPAMLLHVNAVEIADAAFESLSRAFPLMESLNHDQLARTREDLAYITQFTAAARLVDDATVLTDMIDWLRALLANRNVPSSAVDAGLTVLAPLISHIDPEAARMVMSAAT